MAEIPEVRPDLTPRLPGRKGNRSIPLRAVLLVAVAVFFAGWALSARLGRKGAPEESAIRAEGLRLAAQSAAVLPDEPGLALLLALESDRRAPGPIAQDAVLAALEVMREEKVLVGHTDLILGAAFSPDAKRVLALSLDGAIRIWPADPAEAARESKPRELTAEERGLFEIGESGK